MAKLACRAISSLMLFLLLANFSFAAPCTCATEKPVRATSPTIQENPSEEFKIHVEDDDGKYDETVKIDVKANTETIHVPAHNKMDEGDIVHDFNKNLTMIRLPEKETCYLSEISDKILRPEKLLDEMEKMNTAETHEKKTVYSNWIIQGSVTDRRPLSDEMATFCARYPIFRISKDRNTVSVQKTESDALRHPRHTTTPCGKVCWEIQVYTLQCFESACQWVPRWQTSCSTIFC